jgi:membrane protein
MLFGAAMLLSLLPFLMLLSAFASYRIDSDIALYLGLDRRAAGIVTHLLTSSPASLNVATATSLVFVTFGTLAMAGSLQQVYEKVFHQDHLGVRGLYRLLVWVAALCVAMIVEGAVARPVRNFYAGVGLAQLATFAILTPFFWWTMHFLLAGRVPWRRLLPSAIATGLFFAGLGIFSRFYFSSTIIHDDQTFGSIGAIFGILTWFVAIGAVLVIGAVAGSVWRDRTASRTRSTVALGHRRGQLELHSVGVLEGEHVDLERRQAGDLAVRNPRLVHQHHRAFQIGPAADAEAEMVKADPVGTEPIAGWRHRPKAQQQAAPDHDHAAEENLERLGGSRIVWRRRLHGDVEAEQAGVELPAPLKVGHRQTQVMDVSGRNLSGHPVPPLPSAIAGTSPDPPTMIAPVAQPGLASRTPRGTCQKSFGNVVASPRRRTTVAARMANPGPDWVDDRRISRHDGD